jgi:uncharacterized protein
MPTARDWAVVTGASSGLGRAFSLELSSRGYPILLVARRRDALEGLAGEIRKRGGTAEPLVADLSTAEGVETVRRAAEKLPEVGLLVNNAGFGSYGAFLTQPIERALEQVRVNIGAVLALTRALLPKMLERGRGQIINLASILGFMPTPNFAVYAATKGFVLQFSDALAYELRGTGIRVLALCPGVTRTEFSQVAGAEAAQGGLPQLRPEDVVRVALRAAASGRVVRIVGPTYRLLGFLTRITPRFLLRRILGRIYAAPRSPSQAGQERDHPPTPPAFTSPDPTA